MNWTLETTIKPTDTYMGESHECWAGDAEQRNGKYYFYFSECVHTTGVMVADAPGGPYGDALGGPLLPKGLTPTLSYDPGVFTDDDAERSPYIVFGVMKPTGDGYYIAKLNDDMVSLAEEPRKIELDVEADDKPALHKHNGTYYLTWQSFYATADNIYGPYTFRGNTNAAYEHGHYFQWRNQWFHCFGVQDPTAVYRNTALSYVHFKANGEMVEDAVPIEFGVGHYDSRWNRIQACWYMASDGMKKIECPRGGFEMLAQRSGAWLKFPNVRDLPENAKIALFGVSTNPAGCTVEVRAGDPQGELLGSTGFGHASNNAGPGSWHSYFPAITELKNAAGTQDLCLVFQGEGADLCRVDWLRFFK